MMSYENQDASSWLIGESKKEAYQGVNYQYWSKSIVADIQNQYGVQPSYDKAWRAENLL